MSRSIELADVVYDGPIDGRELRYRDLLNRCADLSQQVATAKRAAADLPAQLSAARAGMEHWHRRWCVAITVTMTLVALDLAAAALLVAYGH